MKVTTISVALAVCFAANVSPAAIITGAFIERGVINGARVVSFDVTTDSNIDGFDFTLSGGYGFHGSFNNTGADTDGDTISDVAITFSPALYQPGARQETYFVFSPVSVLSAQVSDCVSGPGCPVLASAIAAPSGILQNANTTKTVAVFSMTSPTGSILLGNGQPFGIAGLANVPGLTVFPISVIGTVPPPSVTPDGGVRGTRPNRIFTQQFNSDLTPANWTIENFTGPTVPTNFSIDGNGLFTWDTTGVPGGMDQVYSLVVRGTASTGTPLFDTGSISIIMPEPTALALASLSLISLVTYRRRTTPFLS